MNVRTWEGRTIKITKIFFVKETNKVSKETFYKIQGLYNGHKVLLDYSYVKEELEREYELLKEALHSGTPFDCRASRTMIGV